MKLLHGFSTVLVLSALSITLAHAEQNNTEQSVRQEHARELMGSHSRLVKTTGRIAHIKSFISQTVSKALKGSDKKYARKLTQAIIDESKRYEFDPVFLLAVIENESSFQTRVVGSSGEVGLMQITPATATWISKKYGIAYQDKGSKTLADPVTNVKIGAAYLSLLREKFDFESRLYLSAYNMGVGHVQKALDKQIKPKEYAFRVMKRYVHFYQDFKKTIASNKAALKQS